MPPDADKDRLIIILNQLIEELDWLLGGFVDSKNVREIGGWLVSKDRLESKDKDVGMSTEDTGTDDIRFFAGPNGEVWFYYVTKTGKLYATDAFISGRIEGSTVIGSEIKTSEDTYPRVELSSLNNLIAAYQDAGDAVKLLPTYSSGPPSIVWELAGAVIAALQPSAQSLGITTSGTTNLSLQSAKDINLSSNGVLKMDGFTAFSGTFDVVADVNFVNQTVDYTRVTVKKGIITNVAAV